MRSLLKLSSSFLIASSFVFPGFTLEAQATPPLKIASSQSQSNYRLSRNVLPSSYELTFEPDLKSFKFRGNGTISICIFNPTRVIELNGLDLKMKNARITGINGGNSQTPGFEYDKSAERIKLNFSEPVKPGNYNLKIEFEGILNDKLRGFYRSHYKDETGKTRWIATTQMEPTDARRMFPCFDEPDMKAKFKLSVVIDADLKAISNGKILKETVNKKTGKKRIDFESSPKMSTYLVALIVGDFKSTETKIACGVPVRVWALKGKEHLASFALKETCKALKYQTDYFGIPYPSNKLDLIAIPDFRSGAMENLGAITFREARLLVDEKKGSNFIKRSVVAVIAHELAHQWFGDLVTMQWWDDIWLNEAFASWMGTKTTEAIRPEYQELARAIYTRNGSMRIDELKATRAIHAEVTDPKQAAEMFDGITYDKGESILWMLEGYVGEKAFQKGIHDYLKANEFGNAKSDDLWNAIGEASSLPVPEIMKTWVFQPGFPILRVDTKNSGTITLQQNRYFAIGNPDSKQIWNTPVVMRNLIASNDTNSKLTIRLDKQNKSFKLPEDWKLALVNAKGRGYYRVLYPQAVRTKILREFDKLSTEEKLAYLSDVKALDKKGMIPVEDRLALILKAKTEKDPLVQSSLIGFARQPYSYLSDKEKSAYQRFVRSQLGSVAKKVGWRALPDESFSVKSLRSQIYYLLGTYGADKTIILEARHKFNQYMKDRNSISADIAQDVLSIVAYNGGLKEYEQVLSAYKSERIPEHEKKLLSALADFRQPQLVERTLKMVLGPEIRAQDGFRVIAFLLKSDDTNKQTWQFVKKNWKKINAKFPGRSMSYIASACGSFDLPAEEKDLNQFYSAHKLPSAKSSVSRMLEKVHSNVLYRKRNENKIRAWILKQG